MKKSIIINQNFHKELKKLSEAFNLPIGRLVEQMIVYFKMTGINPKNAINENPSAMVKVLDKRIVSFLKVQERDILKPLRSEVYSYSKTQNDKLEKLTESMGKLIVKMDTSDKERTKLVIQELSKQQKAIVSIGNHLDAKNKSSLSGQIKSIFS